MEVYCSARLLKFVVRRWCGAVAHAGGSGVRVAGFSAV